MSHQDREGRDVERRGSEKRTADRGRFGTLGGVFTPCTLTILGVIMFLRYGQVVGSAGVWHALIIVAMAKVITTLTAFSVSAIATNSRVRGGGAYYMISRSLGVEFGGSIGVIFFLAQAVSVAMYVIGFTEAFVAAFPEWAERREAIASFVNAVVFVCVFIGAGWTIKVQYVILAALAISLVSFAAGALGTASVENLSANLGPAYPEGQSFFTMFALFFPAATGIMAGANMSGDLANPARSIPRGTLMAIGVTALVYGAMALLLAASTPRADLLADEMIVKSLSLSPSLVTLGVFSATLSSAIGSMMGAPRVLQALARDKIFQRLSFFGLGSGVTNEPRRATVVTFLIAEAGILIGDLNLIAPIITMFFMVTYGYLNFATFVEAYTRNPSYRPTFRYTHWSLALLGTLACLAVMLLIAPIWGIASIVLMALLHWTIAQRKLVVAWGDARSGAAYERARKDLLRLDDERYHPKNWRPNVLAFSGSAGQRVRLAEFGHWLAASRGILTLGQVISGDLDDLVERRRAQERVLRNSMRDHELSGFPAVVVAATREEGIAALVQCHGLGAFQCNAALFGWADDEERMGELLTSVLAAKRLGRSVLLFHDAVEERQAWEVPEGSIDVWWRGKENGPLMAMLAHLMTQNEAWSGNVLRILRAVPHESGREESENHLRGLAAEARIPAEVKVFVGDDPASIIVEQSKGAALVLLGLFVPDDVDARAFYEQWTPIMRGLDTVILVNSAGDVALDV